MKRKRLQAIGILFLLFFSLLAGCAGEEAPILIPEVKEDIYVYDQGDFLGTEAESTMNQFLVELEQQTTIEFAVITIPTLGNLSIESYAVKLGNELGIGKADEDNGILLLTSREDGKVRLEIGKGLQGILTDSISGRILDEYFVPYRDKDLYDEACLNTVQAIINYLAQSEEYDISIAGVNADISLEEPSSLVSILTLILFVLVLAGVIALCIWATSERDSGSSGRGFGGSSFSGGFSSSGGFGGGSFSGGGASR